MKLKILLLVSSLICISVASANPANTKLQSMSESERQKTMTQFMRSSGENCTVTRTFNQGSTKTGDAIWNVQCQNGKAFVILLKNDAKGSTSIMDCAVLKKINAGECFKKN
jgi:hypothetical protein